jgi:hypothetical protein
MRYTVTYRLFHPAYLPASRVDTIEAHTHAELEARLANLLSKWQANGYTIHVQHVKPASSPKK